MKWIITWLEYVNTQEEVDQFLETLPGSIYVGFNDERQQHEIEVCDAFYAQGIDAAKQHVRDYFPDLITLSGNLVEFGCTNEDSDYFSNHDLV